MKKLFMHVGHAKTGTTAIQVYCSQNQRRLEKAGLSYVNVGREHYTFNHKSITQAFLAACDRPYRNDANHPVESLEVYLGQLVDEIGNSPHENFLISSEGLYGLAMYEEESLPILSDLKERLSGICEIHIVYYVRDPFEVIKSNYNQRCKSKNFVGPFLDFFMKTHEVVIDMSHAYEFFKKIFGEEYIITKLYGRLKGSIFVTDFIKSLGGRHTAGPLEKVDNPSLTLDQIEFSRVQAVKALELEADREATLLFGAPCPNERSWEAFVERLRVINENNVRFFEQKFGKKIYPMGLNDLIWYERRVNRTPLLKYYMHG